MVAGQLLGLAELGLASLLERFFGIVPGRSRQRMTGPGAPVRNRSSTRWRMCDTYPLRERLLRELRAHGREEWVAEECQALAATPAAKRIFEPGITSG
jgi:ribonuclease D